MDSTRVHHTTRCGQKDTLLFLLYLSEQNLKSEKIKQFVLQLHKNTVKDVGNVVAVRLLKQYKPVLCGTCVLFTV